MTQIRIKEMKSKNSLDNIGAWFFILHQFRLISGICPCSEGFTRHLFNPFLIEPGSVAACAVLSLLGIRGEMNLYLLSSFLLAFFIPFLLFNRARGNYEDKKMKKILIFALIFFLLVLPGFTQMKPDKISFIDMPIGTTATVIHFTTHSLKEITINNNDDTNYLIVNLNGEIPCNLSITDGISTAASAIFTSATANFISSGVEIGDFIQLYEGTADDGVYEIKSVDSETKITFCQALKMTDTDVDFAIMHLRIKPGKTKTYQIHLDNFSLKASASIINTEITVIYLP